MSDRNVDWITFSLYICLVLVGWLMIYTVGYGDGYSAGFRNFLTTQVGKQTIWIGISLLAMILVFIIDWKIWQTFSSIIYAFAIILLLLVPFFGVKIKGQVSWFTLAGFTFQPAEFGKFATCLALSSFLSSYGTTFKIIRHRLIAFGLIALPIGLVMLQPDAGSALVFTSFLIVLYRAGMPSGYYLIGGFIATILILSLMFPIPNILLGMALLAILILMANVKKPFYYVLGALGVAIICVFLLSQGLVLEALVTGGAILVATAIFLWQQRKQRLVTVLSGFLLIGIALSFSANYAFNNFLKPHQQERINVWLNPAECDPRGALYNVLQSKYAIGSGGIQGRGFLQGVMTKLDYVPEQDTDFIFCTIGEEQGFLGSLSIMLLFLLLLYRLVIIAERQRSLFSRYYAYGIAGIIFVHFFINIGMTMGLAPVIGIPLPFVSRGGSSLLIFTLMISLVLKLDSNRYHI